MSRAVQPASSNQQPGTTSSHGRRSAPRAKASTQNSKPGALWAAQRAPGTRTQTSQVYEVFRREKEGAPLVHAGNVAASSAELALIYAREVYGRRGESVLLWIAPRESFQVLEDSDMLHPTIERSYRLVEGYRMRDKFAAVEERLAQQRDTSHE